MISAISQTGQSASPSGRNVAAAGGLNGFQKILQQAVQASEQTKASDVLAADLNAALQAAGLSAPPAMRIVAGAGGPALADDGRDGQFQSVMAANPALAARVSERLSSAETGRKAALKESIVQFAGEHPTNAMAGFLLQFAQQDKPQAYSLSFNGAAVETQELGKHGWTALKSGDDINRDLLAAYPGYMVTHAVTIEKRKDSDKDNAPATDFEEKLARVLANPSV